MESRLSANAALQKTQPGFRCGSMAVNELSLPAHMTWIGYWPEGLAENGLPSPIAEGGLHLAGKSRTE